MILIVIWNNCLLSNNVTDSKANDDIVVSVPQKPMAIKKEYLGSRFKETDRLEKTPRIKLPIIFTIITFEPIIPNTAGKDVILYRAYAPSMAPKINNINSIAFIINHANKK